jgi:hypothetical protein
MRCALTWFAARVALPACAAILILLPLAAGAAEGFRLAVPAALGDSGLLDYILPRFSLKTRTSVARVAPGDAAEVTFTAGGPGQPVFTGPDATWHMRVRNPEHPGAARFAEWLTSEIGQRTVASYEVDGSTPFTPPRADAKAEAAITFEGDARAGRKLSVEHCGRCHVVRQDRRFGDIGSTPSFFVLRSLSNWHERFQTFYARNPHPAFTQIDGVTDPFPVDRPSPIIPVELSIEDMQALLAYVSTLQPADLGAPLQHQ